MPVKFLADANLDLDIAAGVLRRVPGLEFRLAADVIPPRMKDPDVLAVAASLGCILVSHDVHTMPRHFADYVSLHTSPGLILSPFTVSVGRAIEDLVMIAHASEPHEWVGRIVWLPV